jgi:hypothetical protein
VRYLENGFLFYKGFHSSPEEIFDFFSSFKLDWTSKGLDHSPLTHFVQDVHIYVWNLIFIPHFMSLTLV